MIREHDNHGLPGLPMLLGLVAGDAALVWLLVS